jgi:hypothetical protein
MIADPKVAFFQLVALSVSDVDVLATDGEQQAGTRASYGPEPTRRVKPGDTRILALVGTTAIASTLHLACQGIENSVDGPLAGGVVGILIGALLLLRASKESPVLRSRPFLYGRYLIAASAMAGGVAILCYDGELSPCFTLALLLTIFLIAASLVLRLWGLIQIARSEKARRKRGS